MIDLLASLDAAIRAIVRDELRASGVAVGSCMYYATAPRTAWPRGCRSRRHARDCIRRVVGHERVGSGRETQWRVSRAAYDSHHVRRVERPELHAVAPTDDEALADRALADARLRPTLRRVGT